MGFESPYPVIVIPKNDYTKLKSSFPKYMIRKNTNTGTSLSIKNAIEYFLNNTKDNWLLKFDDDTGIYLPNIKKALKRLNLYYNPNQKLLFGSYLRNDNGGFLSGGAGFLFSRAGAKAFLDNFDHWIKTMKDASDVHFNQILKLFNMTHEDSFFPGMTAGFHKTFYEDLVYYYNNSIKQFPKYSSCLKGEKMYRFKLSKNLVHSKSPKKPLDVGYPVNDIFTYHHYWDLNNLSTNWDDILEKGVPDNIYYYHCTWRCSFCNPL